MKRALWELASFFVQILHVFATSGELPLSRLTPNRIGLPKFIGMATDWALFGFYGHFDLLFFVLGVAASGCEGTGFIGKDHLNPALSRSWFPVYV